ncbi:flagellar biosynthetic protein FliO [Xanthobacter autotrophicus]|uniref:flagellar biosynthetic protein FliO n=1 Tax=Xanthobacter autotrophicus TaxID=280 RepID=UPI003729723E
MMLQQLFGSQLALPIRLAIAVVVIGALLAVTVLVMRRLTSRGRGPVRSGRAGPRLAVLDSVAVDQRRRLVLVRRDEVEHLLLVGGASDIVVEHQIAVEDEDAAIAASPAPALAASREAPALQRAAGRRGLQAPAAPPSPEALAAATVAPQIAPTLPTPEPSPAAAFAPPPAATAPAPVAAPREDRRPLPSRRPLLRNESAASAPRAVRPAAEAPAITPPAPSAYTARPASQSPLMAPAPAVEPDAVRLAPAEPRKAPEIELAPPARVEPAPLPRMEPARSEAPAIDGRLDDLAHRLDAALAHSAPAHPAPPEPQLSLADLLGETPEKPVEPDAATKETAPRDIAPKAEPGVAHKSESAPEPAIQPEPAIDSPQVRPSDRPLSRFLYQSRSRSEPRVGDEVRPRLDPLRAERPPEDGARPAAPARVEPPLRPREFAFRPLEASPREPATREASALDASRREPPALREITREPLRTSEPAATLPRPQGTVDTKTETANEVKAEAKAEEDAPSRAGFIPTVAPKATETAPDAPVVAPEPKAKDPLDDFDAEMANLLGRSSARGH